MQTSIVLPTPAGMMSSEGNVAPGLSMDTFTQLPSFPSTLVSPSFSAPALHRHEETSITESTYEARQQSLMQLLNETLGIVSDLEKKIEAPKAEPSLDCSEPLSFPTNFTFRFPTRTGQIKILNLASPTSARSPQLSILEDDPMTRKLLLLKLHSVHIHIERLKLRLLDSSIRILVTGDVNSGKSTLVNALLGLPEFLVVDQQPCTSAYCEVVLSPSFAFDPQFPVHAVPRLEEYAPEEKCSFKAISISDMQRLSAGSTDSILTDGLGEPYAWFRIFLQNSSNIDLFSINEDAIGSTPLSCSIIDSPGLNHDTFQTMSLFAKQDDIDILIFVINAANHLTLSVTSNVQF